MPRWKAISLSVSFAVPVDLRKSNSIGVATPCNVILLHMTDVNLFANYMARNTGLLCIAYLILLMSYPMQATTHVL
jgi:hypothetical protein